MRIIFVSFAGIIHSVVPICRENDFDFLLLLFFRLLLSSFLLMHRTHYTQFCFYYTNLIKSLSLKLALLLLLLLAALILRAKCCYFVCNNFVYAE